jgi:PASTA domain
MPSPPSSSGSPKDRLFAWVGRHKIASALIALVALILFISAVGSSSQDNPDAAAAPTSATADPTTSSSSSAPVDMVPVPKVTDLSVKDAKAALQDAGFQVTVETKYSHEAAGTVVRVSEKSGSNLERGALVSITVAKAFPTVPNVVGLSQAAATNRLKDVGYKVTVTKQESSQSPGTIISITPSAGSELLPGRSVKIVVAKKPPAPTTPPPANCAPGYSPCLPQGPSDYDCSGGSGNGPAYTKPGVTYRVTGSDPYGLDTDNDGYGCE